jgi:hypothetical protein
MDRLGVEAKGKTCVGRRVVNLQWRPTDGSQVKSKAIEPSVEASFMGLYLLRNHRSVRPNYLVG